MTDFAETNLPPVVFDVDHTLTASEFDVNDLENPKPYPKMVSLAKGLANSKVPVVISTARPEYLRPQTEKWLKSQGIKFSGLYMRGNDDDREDPEVKRDHANQIIKKFGKPVAWYDDKKGNCDMARSLGINATQVKQ